MGEPPPKIGARGWAALGSVFLAALLVRAAMVVWGRPECAEGSPGLTYADRCFVALGDVAYFRGQAESVAAGRGFVNGAGLPAAQHPPAFTVLLAALDKVGVAGVQGQRLATAVVGAVGTVLIARLTWRIVGSKGLGPGIVAGLIAACYPMLWINDITLFSESLLVPMVAGVSLAWYRFLDRPVVVEAVAVGVLLGVAALNRAECLLVAIPFAVGVLRLRVAWSRRLTLGAAAAAATLVVVAPWLLYNQQRFDGKVLFTSTPWITVRYVSCDDVFYGPYLGYYTFGCGQDLSVNALQEARHDEQARERALAYLADNADRVPVQVAASVGRTFEVWQPFDNARLGAYLEGRGLAPSLAGLAWYYALISFGVVGVVALRRRRVPLAPLLSWSIPVIAAVSLGGAVVRYRVPFDVALVVLGALGFWQVARRLPDRLAASREVDEITDGAPGAPRDRMASCAPASAVDGTDSG